MPNTGESTEVAPGIRAGFRIAGHILGSSLVLVEIQGAGRDGSGRFRFFINVEAVTSAGAATPETKRLPSGKHAGQ